ncbi:MAG: LysM peptidoglycan-binding domain-containing protein [Polyangiales bacterium]
MLKRGLPAVVLALSWPLLVRADPAPPAAASELGHHVTAPEGGDIDVDEALRSARRELLALLAKDSVVREDARGGSEHDSAHEPPIRVGSPPPSMTSEVPKLPLSTSGPTPELAWLRNLALPDIPVRWDDRLVKALEYYRTDPRGRTLIRGLFARQSLYSPMILAKLRAAQLPEDLIYVAMVESGFDPKARSEVGALGVWQLMAAPASQYGLDMSRWVDNRMNPDQCTDAALRYLSDVYDDLGSWPLAMAAFNMGYGALLRSVQKYNTNDLWLLSNLEAGLPFETVTYITRVMAYAIIGRNRARFGVADVTPERPLETVTIELPGGLQLARVAKAAGMDVNALAAVNPELRKQRLPPDVKTWPLRLPKERAAHFREKWASQGPLPPQHKQHVLRLGERLSDVAELYGTSTAKLLKLNDLPDGAKPRAGDKLWVPDVDPAPKPAGDKPVVGIPADTFVYADRKRVFYRIAQGDDLAEIARFFQVSVDELRIWNRVATDAKLQRGMFLQLYVPKDTELSQTLVLAPNEVRTLIVGSEEFFNFHESQQKRVRMRYRVKPGDTLRSLAERFELSVGSIARINQFAREKKLEPDSEIIIYVADPNTKRSAAN